MCGAKMAQIMLHTLSRKKQSSVIEGNHGKAPVCKTAQMLAPGILLLFAWIKGNRFREGVWPEHQPGWHLL